MPAYRQALNVSCHIMRQLLSIFIFLFFAPVLNGQTHNILTVTSKADKIFIDTIGNNFKAVKAKAYEVRTTDKNGLITITR
jgi:hypothetical protein